jgi:hypothetical protein
VRTCLLLNGRAAAFPADPEVAAARGMHHELPDQLAVDHLLGAR